ncbi:MFS transporter [Pseudorhodoplanes sp.]|uniref:MFS transporter n=1 Tax=Pseudorhodoplanes sp. TaxID=1934341 RepID=UPI002C9E56DA|nr:MFS transporter [Pseudorhodoplanes sp.]HWV52395.1 MFS transporter [Pseudorhodoplanes sp.]
MNASLQRAAWQSIPLIIICGCLIAMFGFGPRSTLGFFLTPMSTANGWGRDVFALAIAIQMLLWGAAQPFVGAIADRFGPVLVLCVGALLYAIGFGWMVFAKSPTELYLSSGVLVGFGLAGASFTVVIGAFGKLLPVEWRTFSFGVGTAAGSFGQFLFSPLAVALNSVVAWQTTLLIFAGVILLILPLSLALAVPRVTETPAQRAAQQSVGAALREALTHPSFVLLVIGYFSCGFQVFFVTVHLPSYLVDRGLSADLGAFVIAIVGLFNIIGSISAGYLSNIVPKRYILAVIYLVRAIAVAVFIAIPATTTTSIVFGAVMGLLWLSTIPPTNALVAVMFGTRWLTMLAGFAFFSHQVGGFVGVWLGGVLFERTGSYDAMWWLFIVLGILSALINLPIKEQPVVRPAEAVA